MKERGSATWVCLSVGVARPARGDDPGTLVSSRADSRRRDRRPTIGALILSRVAPLTSAIHGAASDPEVVVVRVLSEQRLHDGYRDLVRQLARKGGLRRGLSVARATDILFVLLSADLFEALASGRGWSFAQCKRWLVDVVSQQLLPGK